ncbi:Trp operon leader peptide [Vibrio zhugei]|uniref:Trp operon leader peptide n=1 Tax=Vibrio zhugei TaxID=2479546 RepID=A0ABV7CCR1_9VIBR|nr:Trp operon leader peptide [Vibrio zhugei]
MLQEFNPTHKVKPAMATKQSVRWQRWPIMFWAEVYAS